MILALALLLPAAALGAERTDPVRACQDLLPVFVQSPASITVGTASDGPGRPLAVRIGWTGGSTGDGWIRCWFLPPARTGGALQFTQLESSRFGTLSRYDVQQAFKMLRLKRLEAATVRTPVAATPASRALYLLQQVLNAVTLACVYALVAVAFTLTAAAARTIMFAFGELAALGGWLFLILHVGLQLQLGLPAGLVVGLGVLVCGATAGLYALLARRLVFRKLDGRRGSGGLIASIGLAIAAAEALRLAVGSRPRQMSVVADARIVLVQGQGFDVSVTAGHLWVALGTCLIALWLAWLLRRTAYGRSLRAVVQDPGAAALLGVDIDRVIGRTFMLGGALGGIGGLALVAEYGVADHATGLAVTLKALTAALLGGIGSVPGAFLGGFVIAIVETAAAGYASAAWKDVWVMAVLVGLLVFRPEGLFGPGRDRPPDERI
ncbi:branched-chain amino acid ABC transporter permease [Geminicoccus roseus]|uniref:branched-chain amino acid ABC transporter permease n=1 Tax=Geminicoccus roseus TaxID=404900 RepID=UPI00041A475A|nr:branched-chain amino acid ABC transporter permease [Geminicoccus roseus]